MADAADSGGLALAKVPRASDRPLTVTKVARNAAIIAALRKHGTYAAAARESDCDPRTVKRLCDTDAEASEALMAGLRAVHQKRLKKYELRLADAKAQVAQIDACIHTNRRELTEDYADLTLRQVQRLDHELTRLCNDIGKAHTRVKAAKRDLKHAHRRAAPFLEDTDDET